MASSIGNDAVVTQKTMKLVEKIYLKRKLSVEFAWLNYVKVERLLSWNVAAKANFLWLIENVLLNGSPSKVTRHVKFASKKFLIYQSQFYAYKALQVAILGSIP